MSEEKYVYTHVTQPHMICMFPDGELKIISGEPDWIIRCVNMHNAVMILDITEHAAASDRELINQTLSRLRKEFENE